MKKSCLIIFTLVLMMSVCTGMFLNPSNKELYVAAQEPAQDSYYLLKEGTTLYTSPTAVGKTEGAGDYVVGTENVVVTATANTNFQLAGWQVTYINQSNKTEFFGTDGLTENTKTIKLTPTGVVAEEDKNAVLTYVSQNSYYTKGTFKLSRVFEDLIITPVFDHIYYKVNIDSLIEVSNHENSVEVGSDKLFYETSVTESTITTYSNAYFLIQGNYYYYGDVLFDGTQYYTIHETLEDTPADQKVDYTKGAFRYGDTVDISFDVDITGDVKTSKNIDLQGVLVQTNFLTVDLVEQSAGVLSKYYTNQKDSYLRTSEYSVCFDIIADANYLNSVVLKYHNLYVVDLDILIDGSNSHSKHAEIFGDIITSSQSIKGNVSIYNFYSVTSDDNLQFLVKAAIDNDSKVFSITTVSTISKTIDQESYGYYNFELLDGLTATSKYYSAITNNFVITLNYSSIKYSVQFEIAEYISDGEGNTSLVDMVGNSKDAVELKRGETLSLDADAVEDIENIGYKFVGFAIDMEAEVQTTWSYTVAEDKPVSTKVILCFQKIEYELIFTNYNSKKIGETYPINFITFTNKSGASSTTETITAETLKLNYDEAGTSFKPHNLSTTMKLGDVLTISQVLNSGFVLLGYNLSNDADNYFENNSFTLDANFISSNSLTDKITIFIHEEMIYYTLTYYTEPTHDNKLGSDVITAILDVETGSANITKYTLNSESEYVEISEANDNLGSTVVKIVISQLALDDIVVLKSYPLTRNEGTADEYQYMFNHFTEDGRSTLSYSTITDGTTTHYNHSETILRDREIKVVYSMPLTSVTVLVEEEFSQFANFTFKYVLKQKTELTPEFANTFTVEVGDVELTISDIAFGYEFVGYKFNGAEIVNVDGLTFTQSLIDGSNNIVLIFKHIVYNFYFNQYSDVLNGDRVKFDENDYAEMTVDSTSVTFNKPEGYYVESVLFGESLFNGYSQYLKESNGYRNNEDIIGYNLELTREQFINLVENYGVLNQEIIEVQVRINYEVFVYSVSVQYGLVSPKGNEKDQLVKYPNVCLKYAYKGETITISSVNAGQNIVIFNDVPYGAVATIEALSGAPTGLSVSGWRYENGNPILFDELENAARYLKLNKITKDWVVGYKFSYVSYVVNIHYDDRYGQGEPSVQVNDAEVNIRSIQITLYDKIKISANANRNNGYKFKSIIYKVSRYVEYEYDSETWETDRFNLYIYNQGRYVLNSAPDYVSSEQYYRYIEEDVVYTDDDVFVEESFEADKYVLISEELNFTIEYELLQLTLANHISKDAIKPIAGLVGDEQHKIEIDILNDLLSFKITADDGVSSPRDIYAKTAVFSKNVEEEMEASEHTTVTFNDVVTISIKINNQALNRVDGTIYDLTKGVLLNSKVKISGVDFGVDTVKRGEYLLKFQVAAFMSNIAGDEIVIQYRPELEGKDVMATTIVDPSATDFYNDISLIIDPVKFKYGIARYFSNGMAYATTTDSYDPVKFLTKAEVSATFKENTANGNLYKNNFYISGVTIYCDGKLISEDDFEEYGISIGENYVVTARLMYNLEIVFQVSPNMTFKQEFKKSFICNNVGAALPQRLSVGPGTENDIQIVQKLADALKITYQSVVPGSVPTNEVSVCGKYNVLIEFKAIEGFDWLGDIKITDVITLEIQPKKLYLSYDATNLVQTTKTYDGQSAWGVSTLYNILEFNDGNNLKIKYSDILAQHVSNLVLDGGLRADITENGVDWIADANESKYYHLCLYDIKLKEVEFNKNFELKTDRLIINDYVKILKMKLNLSGVSDYVTSKVYDGTDLAELSTTAYVRINTKIPSGDIVTIEPSKLVLKFEDAAVGINKKVIIDASNALTGVHANNYYVSDITVKGLTIYPYSISAEVKQVGTVTLFNDRGLTDKDKVDLIPLNATLVVEPILVESAQYADIYSKISKYLTGNNQFAIGYVVAMMVDGVQTEINRDLYLSVPKAKNITGVYFLTGKQTDDLKYSTNNGNLVIDLNQMDVELNTIFITQKRILLKPWQIVLIVLVSVMVVTAVVLTFVIIRKRRTKEYSVHDKI